MKFAAIGRTQMLYESIIKCIQSGHEVSIIWTCPAAPEYKRNEQDFANLAKDLDVPYLCKTSINSKYSSGLFRDVDSEVAISVNWLTIINQGIIDLFKYGIINAHAGDLPRYRGNAVPNWAILENEEKITLTLHKMTPELDAGEILLQRNYSMTPSTYIFQVYDFLEENVPEMFVKVLDGLESGVITPLSQPSDSSLSLRCFPRVPSDGLLDWNQPAEILARLVRASAEPFAGAYTFLEKDKLIIWRAYPSHLSYPYLGVPGQVAERRPDTGEVSIITGNGILVLQEIETEKSGRTRASDVIKSIRTRMGMEFSDEIIELYDRIKLLEALLMSSYP